MIDSKSVQVRRTGHTQPVVFLDIDGVLLPFGDGAPPTEADRFPDEGLAALSHLIAATGARIVLSSTWRASTDAQNAILANFARYAAEHGGPLGAIEAFRETTSLTFFSARQREIHQWLQGEASRRVRARPVRSC